MRSSSLVIALLSCAASSDANIFHRSRSNNISTRTSSSWSPLSIRGGSDSPPPSSDGLSSLLSGLDNIPGMPDLSQPPSPEQLEQSMQQMQSLLSSPQFKEMLNDPSKMEEQLEVMRQALLSALNEMENGDNPMMKMMMEQMKSQMAGAFPGGWDGMKEIVTNQEKWKEMMGGLVEVVKGMGEEDFQMIMNQMSGAAMGGGGMGGMGMPPGMGGMGGGMGMPGLDDASGTLAGLDDLSEGED
eukprot:CAMPEP_0113388818 /NCGR_PEP_ID=MMETSP0013_2-20120614/9285_1 /TAXON_ID=2843 ORGANISM="Skeletonema costatum, Strain 1716" /NCGR_SAMPLE_ID=MMETSP0013_2 /ASSEMBLY_ACC=CAM_ASM_000158 /LENGTH=241 /DNA_ID=CAMNT_0000271831 /DNA_START=78 /DNA_END=803 /DNA_ORIENTATION=+ /assembly_acc=CAM_ASM_000158